MLGGMRTITATEASRKFSDLLDAIENGETVTVTRGSRAVAEIRPARGHSGRDLRLALEGLDVRLDDRFETDVADGLSILTTGWRNPWDDE
jgi:prevent-host-death family protein